MEKLDRTLIEGSIFSTMLKFSIPFIVSSILQALYGTVDLLVVGLYTDTAGLSAVSIGTQVMQIVNGIITGITMGGTILIGQYYGAKRKTDLTETIGTFFLLGFIISVLITVLMYIFIHQLLKIVQTPNEAYYNAKGYVLMASSGVIFTFGYNAISAILRGVGDSKRPVYFILVACIINIILDFIFVGYLKMNAKGAAFATIISQCISMILAIIYLSKRNFLFGFKFDSFRLSKDKMKRLTKISLPLSLQEVLLWGSFLVIASIANNMGVVESAAVGIVAKFEVFSMLPPMAFSYALAALTAQNIGALETERAKKALHVSISLSIACSVFFIAWAQFNPYSIMSIFMADSYVSNAGVLYLKTFSIDFALVAIKFNLNGFLNGCGKTTFTTLNGIAASIFIRIPVAFILANILDLLGLGLAAPIASVVSILVSIIFIKSDRWKGGTIK